MRASNCQSRVERLFGSIRREFLDQTFFWTATDLERKLLDYQQYFNHHRAHSGLDGGIPVCAETIAVNLNDFRWQRHCRGLFELPVAAWISNSPWTRRSWVLLLHFPVLVACTIATPELQHDGDSKG